MVMRKSIDVDCLLLDKRINTEKKSIVMASPRYILTTEKCVDPHATKRGVSVCPHFLALFHAVGC